MIYSDEHWPVTEPKVRQMYRDILALVGMVEGAVITPGMIERFLQEATPPFCDAADGNFEMFEH